jgi:hypothetical protein
LTLGQDGGLPLDLLGAEDIVAIEERDLIAPRFMDTEIAGDAFPPVPTPSCVG